MQRQHFVPGKNVIGHSILGEIGVLDRADANRPRDVDLFRFAQVGILFFDNFSGAGARFLQHLSQRHVFAGARLHQFPIFAENVPEWNVAEVRFAAFATRDFENLFKMQSLRRADYVPNRVALQFVDSIINRRNVARGVIESAVALANDGGLVRQLGNIAKENYDRAFADLRDFRSQ